MRYGSICSGIEAATCAWHQLGWTPAWFAEIEPFPSAVLAHHYPEVPNLGDMTKLADRILAGEGEAPDVLVGGTPCQAFSVAGLRKGLSDERGKLTPAFALLADAIDQRRAVEGKPPVIIVWENVPGVLSDKDNAYGCFLGLLAGEDGELQPPGGRWTNAGLVLGPARQVAWRTLDAQYFGVAQRRRRVFLVASARASRVRPVQVLLIEQGVRRDSPPRREAQQGVATDAAGGFEVCGTLSDGANHGGGLNGQDAYIGRILPMAVNHWDGDYPHPTLNQAFNTGGIGQSNQEIFSQRGAGLVQAVAFDARQSDTLIYGDKTGPLDTDGHTIGVCVTGDRTHALKAEGADGSEDGTGRGTPIVAVHAQAIGVDSFNLCTTGDVQQTLKSPKGGVTESMGAVLQPTAYGFQPRIARNGRGDTGDVANALQAQSGQTGKGDAAPCVAQATAVRRLTPVDFDHKHDTFQQGGINHANAKEAGPREVLRALHDALGEEAFSEWGLGVLASFLPPEVLRQAVHGIGIRCPTIEEFGMVYYALSREEDRTERAVLQVRNFARDGRTPLGWGPHEQRPRELGAYLSRLSQPGASAESIVQDLWNACERSGVLRQALSAVQEVGRPARREAQPAPTNLAVRRLVPEECEFLQGFPRNYTRIPWRGKPASECPDGPRYKALGNSMAVPCMAWLGRRIDNINRSTP